MIDREGREKATKLIAAFVAGDATNDDIENGWPEQSRDRALDAIYYRLWSYCSDIRSHKISPRLLSSVRDIEVLSRMVEFLRSDLEYEWRDLGFHNRLNPVLFALRMGILSDERKKRTGLGEYAVWPFFRSSDYMESANKRI